VLLVVLVGVALATHWDSRALLLSAALFFVIRPLSTHLCLIGTPTTLLQRSLMGWFGIRGVGSLYYLTYAFAHHVAAREASELADLTLSVVAISIVVHGATSQPLMAWYEKRAMNATSAPTWRHV
jgi:NhaP-type Na+/H+ or K+/H+ antiporter